MPLSAIDLVAVTYAPGLIGALLVGVSAAKAIAYAQGIPFIGVHHGEAHILAAQIQYPEIGFPYIALLVSGRYIPPSTDVRGLDDYRLLGQTRDDAAGEAYDKVAKLLDLEYPGGPVIDRLAREGDADGQFRSLAGRIDTAMTSASVGLKPRSGTTLPFSKQGQSGFEPELNIRDVAASFQAAVVDMLLEKTLKAAAETGADKIVVAGGVAANSSLRKKMQEETGKRNITPLFTRHGSLRGQCGNGCSRRIPAPPTGGAIEPRSEPPADHATGTVAPSNYFFPGSEIRFERLV